MISYTEFLAEVTILHARLDGYRYGQVYFNHLRSHRPDIAEAIRSTIHDPFHRDIVSTQCHDIVERKWNETTK